MDIPYEIRITDDNSVIFDTFTGGAISPDGNEAHLAFLAWVEENGEPPTVPIPEEPVE